MQSEQISELNRKIREEMRKLDNKIGPRKVRNTLRGLTSTKNQTRIAPNLILRKGTI